MKLKLLAAVTFAAFAIHGASQAAPLLTIDDFSQGNQSVCVGNSSFFCANQTFDQSALGGLNVIGGSRELEIGVYGSLPAGDFAALGVIPGGSPSFAQNINSDGSSAWGILRYDGNANNALDNAAGTGLGADLSTYNSIVVNIRGNDQATGTIAIRLWSDTNEVSELELGVPLVNPTTQSPMPLVFNLANFAQCTTVGAPPGSTSDCIGSTSMADFSSLTAIEVILNAGDSTAIDLSLSLVAAVPEPGTLALLGASLLGLGARRWRRKR